MKHIISLFIALVMMMSVMAVVAEESDQHSAGTVAWALDAICDYGAGIVVIARNDGKTEMTTIQALIECYDNNPVRFEARYENAEIVLVGVVGKISGRSEYNRHVMQQGSVEVQTSSSDMYKILVEAPAQEAILNLNVGDLVVASGRITSVDGWKIYLLQGDDSITTLEPYAAYRAWAAQK